MSKQEIDWTVCSNCGDKLCTCHYPISTAMVRDKIYALSITKEVKEILVDLLNLIEERQ